jgi:hypothetical protein
MSGDDAPGYLEWAGTTHVPQNRPQGSAFHSF